MNPMDLRRGISAAVEKVVEILKSRAQMISTTEEIAQVLRTEIVIQLPLGGNHLCQWGTRNWRSDCQGHGESWKGRRHHCFGTSLFPPLLTGVQDGKTLENELEVVEGMKFDRGFISPYFANDQKTMKCEYEDALILIVEKKISG